MWFFGKPQKAITAITRNNRAKGREEEEKEEVSGDKEGKKEIILNRKCTYKTSQN